MVKKILNKIMMKLRIISNLCGIVAFGIKNGQMEYYTTCLEIGMEYESMHNALKYSYMRRYTRSIQGYLVFE